MGDKESLVTHSADAFTFQELLCSFLIFTELQTEQILLLYSLYLQYDPNNMLTYYALI